HLAHVVEIGPIQSLGAKLLGAKRKTGTVVFQGAKGKLYVNGRYWGRVPGRHQLRVGPNKIMVKNTRGVLLNKTVKVRHGATMTLMVRDPTEELDMPPMDLEPMVPLGAEPNMDLELDPLEPLPAPAAPKDNTEPPSMDDLELMPLDLSAQPQNDDPASSVLREPMVGVSVDDESPQWLTSWWTWGGVGVAVVGATVAAVVISRGAEGPGYDATVALDLRNGVRW
ncbi:MAG: hypothetical protein VYA34_07090, partial [Myxococcota bacterium]|nr:hypothetical protein [Myxococcota bacterium]